MTKNEYYSHWKEFEKLPYDQQVSDLNRFIAEDRAHWEDICLNGCSDPFWEDGFNMNLVRNHIIGWVRKLHDLKNAERQLTMFDFVVADGLTADVMSDTRIPPEMPNTYMAKDRPMAKNCRK